MPDALHQNFMRADRIHGVIDPLSVAMRLAIYAVKRRWMHHCRNWPPAQFVAIQGGNDLRRVLRSGTKWAMSGLPLPLHVIAHDDPGACNRIFTQFHATSRKTDV